jgi:hypothetical protein
MWGADFPAKKTVKSHLHIFLVTVTVSALALTACSGPQPAPQQQPPAKAAEPQESRSAVEQAPPAQVEQPRAQAVPKPKPVAKPRPPATETPAALPANTPQPTVSNVPPNPAGGLTLPAPVPPPIDVPAPPAPIEVKDPEPRQVTVPSGALVAVRMVDSVSSETAHVGETFKASLDVPIVVDNDTVFPKGSQVFVKVSKVDAAGRVRGKSELQLQLDRIFLGNKSYTLQSSTYENTGASQGTRTAKTGALGAAIGAAIGAIAGGGKGAVIGGATGAGAGVGVEAARKGEQIRVDSESRLDFRLEESLQVTLQFSPLNTIQPRSSPSDLPRFGTRQK